MSEGDVSGILRAAPDGGDIERRRAEVNIRSRLFGRTQPAPMLGRYVLREQLGRGGMGVVHAAYDPDLDRMVAIKLVHSNAPLNVDTLRTLLREAQALAAFAHPNVVEVYDVGAFAEGPEGLARMDLGALSEPSAAARAAGIFLVMELVDGQTLRKWCEAEPRSWREVARIMVDAGHGLASAHASGIIHRDFKPANVLVDRDGHARVLDFGLARMLAGDEGEVMTPESPAGLNLLSARSLDTSDTIRGTPAYMSPEQLGGGSVDATSDQFAFCVTLYEALYGERPYAGDSPAAIAFAMHEGRLRPTPKRSNVPSWLHDLVVRGLAVESRDRWPSMDTLLATLARDPAASRRRWLLAGGTAAVVAGLGYGVVSSGNSCDTAGDDLDPVWNATRAAEGRSAFQATALPYAEDSWSRVEALIDEYAGGWVQARTDACEMARIRPNQSDELLDLRIACLDGRQRDLRAFVDMLAGADAGMVRKSVAAASNLPELASCTDVDYVRSAFKPPDEPELVAGVTEVRDQVARAQAQQRAGRYEPALELAQAADSAAEELGYRPLQAEAKYRLGSIQQSRGLSKPAEASLEAAYFLARGCGHDDAGARAAIDLVYLVGTEQSRFAAGRAWARHAWVEVERVGKDSAHEARLEAHIGQIDIGEEQHESASRHLERARELTERVLGPEHPAAANAWSNLGNLARDQGRYAEAREAHARALEIRANVFGPRHPVYAGSLVNMAQVDYAERRFDDAVRRQHDALEVLEGALGRDHPSVGAALNNIGMVELAREHYDEARTHFARAEDIFIRTHGPDHPDRIAALLNQGVIELATGSYQEARAHFEAGRVAFENTLGTDHPKLAAVLENLGNVEDGLGNVDGALEYHERALRIRALALGSRHPEVASSLGNIGLMLYAKQRYGVALAHYRRSLVGLEWSLGPNHPMVARMLARNGQTLVALDRAAEAVELLDRAVSIQADNEVERFVLGFTRYQLARALVAARGDEQRAVELARLARADLAAAGAAHLDGVKTVDDWLADHGG